MAPLAVAGVLGAPGLGAAFGSAWGLGASAAALAIFVIGGFWANYTLFGDIRLAHTGTNVVVVIIVLWFLWLGYSSPRS